MHAQEDRRWYTVEMIIFANTYPGALQEELWPEDVGRPDTGNTVSLVSDVELALPGVPVEFQQLELERLSEAHRQLQRSSRYRVIKATAWRLPGLAEKTAPPILVLAGKRYLEDGQPAPPLPEPLVNVNDAPIAVPGTAAILSPAQDTALYELEGTVKISLSKFLDVNADLLYRTNVRLPDTQGVMVDEFRSFRLRQFRRMKSNTVHYLDHPMFGVVIAIDRYEIPPVDELQPDTPTTVPAG